MAKKATSRTRSRKVNVTKNYRLFERSADNRQTKLKGRGKLIASLKTYSWLHSMPLSAYRNGDKKLIVKDGQHRLDIAAELGIPVPWVEEPIDFDISVVNSTAKIWQPIDHAEKWAAAGKREYQEGIEFAQRYKIAVGLSFALLSGTFHYSNVIDSFTRGTYKIKDRDWANRVAGIYSQMVALSPSLRRATFLQACAAVCRVPEFKEKRLLTCANRCRDKLASYSTRDAYLAMLEEVYNYGHKTMLGLKSSAIMVMRARNATSEESLKAKRKAKKN